MIEKLEPIKTFNCSDTPQAKMQHHSYHNDCINKINEIIDYINHSNHEYESIDDVVDDFVKVNESAHKFRSTNERLRKELDRTRNALDVAVDELEKMTWGCNGSDAEHLLKKIKQITETKE